MWRLSILVTFLVVGLEAKLTTSLTTDLVTRAQQEISCSKYEQPNWGSIPQPYIRLQKNNTVFKQYCVSRAVVPDPEWQNLVSAGGMYIGHGRTKRFVAVNENQPNLPHQACLLPDGSTGHCRHLHHCIQDDFKIDFMKFMDYMCIIQQRAIGVCCPDSVADNQIAMVPKDKDGVAFMVDRI